MNIFTKPINEITFDDVVAFCQQGIKEGVNLDYKQDFPAHLEKIISAFANTFGGIIIIGVKEKDGKPEHPFAGMDYQDKLEDRITNVIVSNIYPPVFPEIQICPPKEKKTFVVIRVPQSNETPHALYNNTKVYIRTANRNKLEDLATIEQIEWLKNRRQKSEQFREILCQRAEEHFQNMCRAKNVRIDFGELTLSFAPLYPQKPQIQVQDIERICRDITIYSYLENQFPYLPTGLQPVHDGMVHFHIEVNTQLITFTEVNRFGLFFYKEDMGWVVKGNQRLEDGKYIPMDRLIRILDLSFAVMADFYNRVGYWGLVKIVFSLKNLLGTKLIIPDSFHDDIRENQIQNELSWDFIISAMQLNDPLIRQSKLLEIGRDLAWSFRFRIGDDFIIKKLKSRGRWIETKTT